MALGNEVAKRWNADCWKRSMVRARILKAAGAVTNSGKLTANAKRAAERSWDELPSNYQEALWGAVSADIKSHEMHFAA